MRLDLKSVGSFFGFRVRYKRRRRGDDLTDVMFSDLRQARSLGSFGCSVFTGAAEGERLWFRAPGASEMAKEHQEEDRTRKGLPRRNGGEETIDLEG